jgi:hypothetical protein
VVKVAEVSLKTIYKELAELRGEITELKELLITEPALRKDAIRKINEARERVKVDYVPHEKVMREFLE